MPSNSELVCWLCLRCGLLFSGPFTLSVSVRCAPPNGADFDGLVSTIDSGHLGALYGCEAEEAALAG